MYIAPKKARIFVIFRFIKEDFPMIYHLVGARNCFIIAKIVEEEYWETHHANPDPKWVREKLLRYLRSGRFGQTNI